MFTRKSKMKMLQRKQDSFFRYQNKQLMNKRLSAQRSKQQQDFEVLWHCHYIHWQVVWFLTRTCNGETETNRPLWGALLHWPGAGGGCPQNDRDSQYGPTLWRVFVPGGNTESQTGYHKIHQWEVGGSFPKPRERQLDQHVQDCLSVPGSNAFVERIFFSDDH